MKDGNAIKVLCCNTTADSHNRIEQILLMHHIKNVLIQIDPIAIKWMAASHKPDFILTDDNFWEQNDANNLVKDLRQANNTPVLIWANAATEKIVAAIFNLRYVYYIRKTEDSSFLIDAIAKSIAPYTFIN